ncbi:phage tail assembly protein [Streptomyces decoyicus]|uniref:phage tail assembly protein n=1 Tax=Streptomyces decoyicus TaxID=249567 RepID=UPI00386EA037|nr:phage tail assembly protein [Streptomyces decoyicus]
MPQPLSITALRAEAQTTYEAQPLLLDSGAVVGLRSMLMLADETDYATVEQLLEEISIAGENNRLTAAIGAMRKLLLTVADDATVLEPELAGWELGLLMNLIERWQSGTQVPEASSSAS